MKTLFQKRRQQFLQQCLKYLRYVLNDHFVLVLLVFLGFILFQYRQLLTNLPEASWLVVLGCLVILGLSLSLGRLASYSLVADKVFLLPQEEAMREQIALSRQRSMILWTSLQSLLLAFLTPLMLTIGWSWYGIVLLFAVMVLGRWLVLGHQVKSLWQVGRLDWDKVILAERERQQTILKFFALFTTVKGISTRTKRRAYLDGVLRTLPKKPETLWLNLYARAFLRSGDYLALTLRLLVMSLMLLWFVKLPIMSAVLALLCQYLILFQLLALYYHYDYQYLTQLYPLDRRFKRTNLLYFLRGLGLVIVGMQSLCLWSVQGLGILWLGTGLLLGIYLPYKLKQMID